MGQVTEPWREPAAPLVKLAQLLGIPGELHQYESPEEWSFTGDVDFTRLGDPAALAAFAALLHELQERYGDALELSVKGGSWTVFEVGRAQAAPSIDELRAAIEETSPSTLDVRIRKSELAAAWGLTDPAVATRLFFFAEALARALSIPLIELDAGRKALFREAGRKLVILVPAHDIELDGVHLAVVGGPAMPRWRESIPVVSPAVPPSEPEMLALARKNVNWVLFDLTYLTPAHLHVEEKRVVADDPVAAALYAQLAACSLVYLARQSTWNAAAKRWTCTFASDRQETDVEAGGAVTPSRTEWGGARTLAELAQWTYDVERDADDRLIVVQQVAVDALQNNSAAANATEVLRLAGELAKRARWGWEAFIGGELKKYLSQVKELEETVQKTTREYNEQVQALTKTLIDSMLAAVAVIVGSFIAAMFKSPFQPYVFQFGTGAYAAYLFLFPMLIGLTATWQRFRNSKESFETRRNSFATRLPPDTVRGIVEPAVDKSEGWFARWYGATAATYLVVLIALLLAVVHVPASIQHWNDDFRLLAAEPNQPMKGDLLIRGENFDKDEEIVVLLGGRRFTNTGEQPSLKVHGSTVLTLKAEEGDLAGGIVTVRQGKGAPRRIRFAPRREGS